MTEITLSPSRRIRIWNGSIPDLSCVVVNRVQQSLDAPCSILLNPQTVGVELLVYTGARFYYGLLVGEFTPVKSQHLTISVAIVDPDRAAEPVEWTLAKKISQVFAGLPAEYAESVVQGAISAGAVSVLGAGSLQFNYAAHSPVGSSSNIFQRITRVIVYLLSTQGRVPPNRQLLELLGFKD